MTITAPGSLTDSVGSDADAFERNRRRLRAVAYRIVGSVSDAEDIVQECYLRWHGVAPESVDSPERYLTATVTRLAIDHLRSARVKREFYVGEWLPEPLVENWIDQGPETALEAEGDLSLAFLLLLERLPPDQRTVYVLREALDLGFEEIADILEKTATACRQAYKRARERIGGPPRYDADRTRAMAIARDFRAASVAGDYAGLLNLLSGDTVLLGDGGGKIRAARNPILGADRVARFMIGVLRKPGRELTLLNAAINGQPGLVLRVHGQMYGVIALDIRDGRIVALYHVVNPDKLRHLREADLREKAD